MIETPRELAGRFERGEIDRMEFQAMMSIHQRELIREMEEERQNPVAGWVDGRLARGAVRRLVKRHSVGQIREVLVALGEARGFPLGRYLWNAGHVDVPLYCFFRMRKEPIFWIVGMREVGAEVEVELEIYESKNREKVVLVRDGRWRLAVQSFSTGGG